MLIVQNGGPSVNLIVSDNGIGIVEDQLPHIFERFYRGDPSRTRESGSGGQSDGAGLGLSIARWIVDEHHGSIAPDSRPGGGTRMVVTLPADSSGLSSS